MVIPWIRPFKVPEKPSQGLTARRRTSLHFFGSDQTGSEGFRPPPNIRSNVHVRAIVCRPQPPYNGQTRLQSMKWNTGISDLTSFCRSSWLHIMIPHHLSEMFRFSPLKTWKKLLTAPAVCVALVCLGLLSGCGAGGFAPGVGGDTEIDRNYAVRAFGTVGGNPTTYRDRPLP